MKKLMYLLCLPAMLFIASCSGSQTENKEKGAAEIKAADSLTPEMDNLQGEMETLGSELDDAVNALGNSKKDDKMNGNKGQEKKDLYIDPISLKLNGITEFEANELGYKVMPLTLEESYYVNKPAIGNMSQLEYSKIYKSFMEEDMYDAGINRRDDPNRDTSYDFLQKITKPAYTKPGLPIQAHPSSWGISPENAWKYQYEDSKKVKAEEKSETEAVVKSSKEKISSARKKIAAAKTKLEADVKAKKVTDAVKKETEAKIQLAEEKLKALETAVEKGKAMTK